MSVTKFGYMGYSSNFVGGITLYSDNHEIETLFVHHRDVPGGFLYAGQSCGHSFCAVAPGVV